MASEGGGDGGEGVVGVVENVGDGGWMAVGTAHTRAYIDMLLAARTVPVGGVDEPGCRPPEVGSLRPPEFDSVRWRGRVLSQGGDLRRSAQRSLSIYRASRPCRGWRA